MHHSKGITCATYKSKQFSVGNKREKFSVGNFVKTDFCQIPNYPKLGEQAGALNAI